jgi:eukaryotic-like serine/threonine-protein kinase
VTEPIDRLRSALGDRYVVERQAGEGGMATVFLARDIKHERAVAIKVLRPELSASLGGDRFLREIRVAATLQHPNILGLYDSGETEGLLYYVMPFIEGESLRHRLDREQQLPLHDALRVTREAAEALQYAHERGIVHRDIKPENILLQGGHALVADFGIARAVTEAGGEKLTQTGMAIGTPYYMSPEQSLGSDRVDARSDVYSLGCVLYELLIGQPPFMGPNAMAIMARHSMEKVPSLQVVRAAVPDEVEDIVLHALEKTPADRFQSMQEMVQALSEAEADVTMQRTAARRAATASRRVPTQATVVTPAALPPKPSRKLAWIGGGVAALLIAAGAGWTIWRQNASKTAAVAQAGFEGLDPHRIAVLYFQDLGGKDSLGFLSDGLTEALIGELGEVPGLSVISRNGVALYRGDRVPRDSIARALKVGTLVVGSVEKDGDRARVTVRLVDGASGAEFERESFEQPEGNYLALRDSLTREVATFLRRRLGTEVRLRDQRQGAHSPEAWALVQRAEQAQKEADSLVVIGDTSGGVPRAFDRADTLLAQSQALDPTWVDPVVLRGSVAYRRSRLEREDPLKAAPLIARGMSFADQALKAEPQNPDALELRGNLQYWRWLLGLSPDKDDQKKLLQAAQNDLEAATRINPSQAGAWGSLSHLYYNSQTGTGTDVALAARRAYEEDAYLSNADVILTRLFYASYDLGQSADAQHWCEEGQRRFSSNSEFTECRIWIMTLKSGQPDPALAWRLLDTLLTRVPPPQRAYKQLAGQLAVAAVIARAGLKDSARRVVERSRGGPEVDPTEDLLYDAAFVYTLIGDKEDAIKALKRHLVANPSRAASLATDPGWWFRDLESEPEFKRLVAVAR